MSGLTMLPLVICLVSLRISLGLGLWVIKLLYALPFVILNFINKKLNTYNRVFFFTVIGTQYSPNFSTNNLYWKTWLTTCIWFCWSVWFSSQNRGFATPAKTYNNVYKNQSIWIINSNLLTNYKEIPPSANYIWYTTRISHHNSAFPYIAIH